MCAWIRRPVSVGKEIQKWQASKRKGKGLEVAGKTKPYSAYSSVLYDQISGEAMDFSPFKNIIIVRKQSSRNHLRGIKFFFFFEVPIYGEVLFIKHPVHIALG